MGSRPLFHTLSKRAVLSAAPLLVLGGCWFNPFHHTRDPEAQDRTEAAGQPGDPASEARRSIQPAQPAAHAAGSAPTSEPGAGFDFRLVRLQPGVHEDTEQPCDLAMAGAAQAVDARQNAERDAQPYPAGVTRRISVTCRAPTGFAWVDVAARPPFAAQLAQLDRGRRIRLRIRAADGGYFGYPIAELVGIGDRVELPEDTAEPTRIEARFDLTRVEEDPSLMQTTQTCSVSQVSEIELVRPADRRRRNYPAGVQNRMTVNCRHAHGDEAADLLFMPAQALAALSVRRGSQVPVQVVRRHGGYVDYPILRYAGQ